MVSASTHPDRNLFGADLHSRIEDERVFVFGNKLLVLAAVRPPHVLQLDTVELRRARAGAAVDRELALGAVTDLTHAVDVLVAVRRDFPLVEQRQLDRGQVVLKAQSTASEDPAVQTMSVTDRQT